MIAKVLKSPITWVIILLLVFLLVWRLGAVGKAVDLAGSLLIEKQTNIINKLKSDLKTSLDNQQVLDKKIKTNEVLIKKIQSEQEVLKKGVADVKEKLGAITIPTSSNDIAVDLRKHGLSSATPTRRPK